MNADVEEGREISMSIEESTVAMISRAEIDQQITTAKRYPRSIKRFSDEATAMVTLNESIAQQCIYALPRDNKVIEGASARFGEIIASAWGNCRAGARIVNEGAEFITAQGVFHDLERNVAITYEVQRRIVDKYGKKFKPDMIGVTANAACSIALRNAILKGIPKAFWEGIYKKARAVIAGDLKTLANKRADAIAQFVIFGITEAQILAKLGREGAADITVDDLVVLFGLLTAIKDGDTTPEQVFGEAEHPAKKAEVYPADQFAKDLPGWRNMIAAGNKTADQIIFMAQTKNPLTDEQKAAIRNNSARSAESTEHGDNWGGGAAPQNPGFTFTEIEAGLLGAKSAEKLTEFADLIGMVAGPKGRAKLTDLYNARKEEFTT